MLLKFSIFYAALLSQYAQNVAVVVNIGEQCANVSGRAKAAVQNDIQLMKKMKNTEIIRVF